MSLSGGLAVRGSHFVLFLLPAVPVLSLFLIVSVNPHTLLAARLLILLNCAGAAFLAAVSISDVGNAPLRMHAGVKSCALYLALTALSVTLVVAFLTPSAGSGRVPVGQYGVWLADSSLLAAGMLFFSPGLRAWRRTGLTILGGLYVLSASDLIVTTVKWVKPAFMIGVPLGFWACSLILLGLWSDQHLHPVICNSIQAKRNTGWLVPLIFVVPVAAASLVGTGERLGLYGQGNDEALLGSIICSLAAIVAGWFASLVTRSDESFWELFHGAGEAIIIVEPISWLLEECNAKAVEVFGDLLGKPRERSLADIIPVLLSHSKPSDNSVTEVRAGEVAEVRFKNQLGHECWGELHMRDVGFRGNKKVMVYIRDVSRRKTLEQEHAMALKVRAFGEWAGGIAHDFNNLLTGIVLCSEVLAAKLAQDSDCQMLVNTINASARSAEDLTRRLLRYGRVRHRPDRKTNLNELICSVARLLKCALEPAVSVHMELAQNVGDIVADPIEMEEILINLAFNARDAMTKEGSLTFETRIIDWIANDLDIALDMPPGRYVLLSVRDTGIGMDEATAARALEPFFTTKSEGHGTGLGLWTVSSIVTRSEGYMNIESAVGKGTNVRIFLPASNVCARAAESSASSAA